MSGLILALFIGFLLGVLLMIFLVAGREEEDLLDRVEKAEFSRARLSRASDDEREHASERAGESTPSDDD